MGNCCVKPDPNSSQANFTDIKDPNSQTELKKPERYTPDSTNDLSRQTSGVDNGVASGTTKYFVIVFTMFLYIIRIHFHFKYN